jgi:hypothetical protein
VLVTEEKNANGMKWPSLIAKNGKNYEEKSLVGLTQHISS